MTRPLRFLLSYFYYGDQDIPALRDRMGGPERVALFCDSGAISAKNTRTSIDVAEYGAWLQANGRYFQVAANLDVIGDAEATLRNQRTLEGMGLPVLPVFHYGTPWRYLDTYLDAGHRYIALGGMVGEPNARAAWLVRAFQMAGDRAVFHGFGLTSWRTIRDFPFYSVDSSSWGSGHRYGNVNLFDRGRWVRVNVGDRECYRHAALIRAHGEEPADIAERGRYHYSTAVRISARAWMRAAAWLKERHGAIAIPGDEPGPHLYLAMGTGYNEGAEAKAWDALRDDPGPHVYLADSNPEHITAAAVA